MRIASGIAITLALLHSVPALAQPQVASVSPDRAQIAPGGAAVSLSISGTGLSVVSGAGLVLAGRPVTGVTATIKTPASVSSRRGGTSRLVLDVSAVPAAPAGTYQLVLIAGREQITVRGVSVVVVPPTAGGRPQPTRNPIPAISSLSPGTAGAGIISREAAVDQRRALAPLKARTSAAGMRAAEAEYAKALHDWALAQDRRLLELQQIHSSYERLQAYRDRAEANGEDTAHLDPRFAGMEKTMAALSDEARQEYLKLAQSVQRVSQRSAMSSVLKRKVDWAKRIINTTRG